MKNINDASNLTRNERKRQVEKEGWTTDYDDNHEDGELAIAALCYEQEPSERDLPGGYIDLKTQEPNNWPLHTEWWKPTPDNRMKELVKAGALYRAEIERLLRRLENVHKKILKQL